MLQYSKPWTTRLLMMAGVCLIIPSVAAGPVGRDAEASTNGTMSAQMLSYSRAQGVFAGVSLSGTSLGPDSGANEKLYGKKVEATQIIEGSAGATPDSAKQLLAVLT